MWICSLRCLVTLVPLLTSVSLVLGRDGAGMGGPCGVGIEGLLVGGTWIGLLAVVPAAGSGS